MKIIVSLPARQTAEDRRNRSQPLEIPAIHKSQNQAPVRATPVPLAKESLPDVESLPPPATPEPDWTPPEFGLIPYLPVEVLEEKPEVTLDVPIDPADLRDFHEGGTARLVLWINSAGSVDKVSEEYSTLRNEARERLQKHFKAARFKPGILAGQAVATMLRIEVNVLPIEEKPLRSAPTVLKN